MSGADSKAQRLLDAQVGVLGSMLIDSDCVADVLSTTSTRMFVSDTYRVVYKAIRDLFSTGKPVDSFTVRAYLKERTGDDYSNLLLQMMDTTPTAANVMAYVDVLQRDSVIWRMQQIGAALAGAETLQDCESLMSKANDAMACKDSVEVWDMARMWQEFSDRHADQQPPEYLRWGMGFVDERVCAEAGDFCVLGGYSSDGKTSLALYFAASMAKTKRVGFFSLETNKAKLADRLMTQRAQVDFSDIKHNRLGEKQWEELAYAATTLASGGLHLIQLANATVAEIRAIALREQFEVIYVDYLQLLLADGGRNWSRPEQVGAVSRSMQQMAHDTGITVVALSQLTPGDNRKKNEAPTMYDLRESKQITQDADIIFLLYREDPDVRDSRRFLKCDKNKDGEAGWYKPLIFRGKTQTFEVPPSQVNYGSSKPVIGQVTFRELQSDGTEPF